MVYIVMPENQVCTIESVCIFKCIYIYVRVCLDIL